MAKGEIKMKALTLKNFDPELHKAIKVQAAKEEITIKDLIEKMAREYLAKKEKEVKKDG